MRTKNFWERAALVVALGASLTVSAPGQGYVFTKVVDESTPRPDGAGPFNLNALTTPAFDGQWVVFRDDGNKDDGSLAAIWSFNTLDGSLHKLVDLKMRIPGGTATFTNLQLLDTAPSVRHGMVVFLAFDSRPGANSEGLYSVPAAGGPIARIADIATANPSGGTFTVFDVAGSQMGAFSFDGATVVFNGQGSGQTLGNYSAKPDGTSIGLIADTLHPFTTQAGKVLWFKSPAVSGGNIVMMGAATPDPATGYHGIYLGSTGGNGVVSELLNSNQKLPGASAANSHIRFDAPVLAFDGTLVAFRAADSGAVSGPSPLYGLYSTDLSSHAVNRIVDVTSTLTGLGRLRAIGDQGVAVSQGNVLFKAADDTAGYPGNNALYLWKNDVAARIVGTGDRLDGGTVQVVGDPGAASLYGAGFALNVEFNPVHGLALYLAKPASGALALNAVTNGASYAASSVAPGEIVALFGSGLGPANPAYFTLDTANRIPASLAGVRVLVNGMAAPLIYAADSQISAILPFEIAGQQTATIRVEYNGNASTGLTAPVTNSVPGLFSVSGSGSGPAAILNFDGSYNSAANPAAGGSIVVLYASGLGTLAPAQPTGSVVGATALPALVYPVTVEIGGKNAPAVYAGPAPLAVAGLYQINCTVPPGLSPGAVSVVLVSDGRRSQPNLTVFVR